MFNIYEIDEEREEKLWNESIFIFDTCSLHDFYFLNKSYREEIYKEIFENNKDRFWIPKHVEYEFLKNRKKIIEKPIKKHYEPLEEDIKGITKILDVKKKLQTIIENTSKKDKHPFIEQTNLELLSKELEVFLLKTNVHKEKILEEISLAKNEVFKIQEKDDVLEMINKHFTIGEGFSFSEILEISKEGKHRYEFKIPPGYGDYYNGEKKGTQIFGDLIIWKEILEYSKSHSKSIVFITNDIVKDNDWCEIDSKTKRIINPRHELIKEINDYSNVEFWMYNFEQFLFFSNKYLKSNISQPLLEEVKSFLAAYKSIDFDSYIEVECDNCQTSNKLVKAFFPKFKCNTTNEKDLGIEHIYVSSGVNICDCCNEEINVKISVSEYPKGTISNEGKIDIMGGKLVSLNKFNYIEDVVNLVKKEEEK